MASKISKPDVENWPGRRLDFVEYGRALARRRAEYEAKYGPIPVPRNSGERRTASKKALLAAIDEAAAKKGFRW